MMVIKIFLQIKPARCSKIKNSSLESYFMPNYIWKSFWSIWGAQWPFGQALYDTKIMGLNSITATLYSIEFSTHVQLRSCNSYHTSSSAENTHSTQFVRLSQKDASYCDKSRTSKIFGGQFNCNLVVFGTATFNLDIVAATKVATCNRI